MGSSAASAAAGAAAVNALFGSPLTGEQLVLAGLVSEAAVSGYHADNIAPAVLGGFVLVRSMDPLDLQCLPFGGEELWFTLVNPVRRLDTAAGFSPGGPGGKLPDTFQSWGPGLPFWRFSPL